MKPISENCLILSLAMLFVLHINAKPQGEIWQLKIASNTIFKPVTFTKLIGDSITFEVGKEKLSVHVNCIDEIRNIKSNSDLPLKGALYGSTVLGMFSIIFYFVNEQFSYQHNGNPSVHSYYVVPLIGVAGGLVGAAIGGLLGTISWLTSSTDTVYKMNELTSGQRITLINNRVLNPENDHP